MRDLKADSRFIKELSQGHMLEAQKYALSLYLEACERALAAEATIEKQNQGGLELARRIDELEAEVEEYKKDINMWGDIVAELHIENAKLRKVLGKLKFNKNKERCQNAEKLPDGKCRGYQKSINNDEPAEMCKECAIFDLFEEDCALQALAELEVGK